MESDDENLLKVAKMVHWSRAGVVFFAAPVVNGEWDLSRALYWRSDEILTHDEYMKLTSLLHEKGLVNVLMPCQRGDDGEPPSCRFANDVCPCRKFGLWP